MISKCQGFRSKCVERK